MGRIARSFEMFKASLRVLNTRKELVLFPVLSGAATLIVAAGFLVPGLLASRDSLDAGDKLEPASYVIFFVGYLVLAYVAIFFQAALISQADIALQGGDPSVAGAFAWHGRTHWPSCPGRCSPQPSRWRCGRWKIAPV